MSIDVLILNTAVVDFRGSEFSFVDTLAGAGGLAKGATADMPDYSQEQYDQWIKSGKTTAGGPGNTAPLLASAGIKTAVAVNLGKGDYDGLDACGRYFHDVMTENNVDMSQTYIHPELPTGATFIHDKGNDERGGIVYFPNANNDFDFEYYKNAVKQLDPKIVYYMYSGLSERGDANDGGDLADFIKWSRDQGCVTIVDSHTLAGNPEELIESGKAVDEYKLLAPLLPELDLFFTSSDEAQMIANTLAETPKQRSIPQFLYLLTSKFWTDEKRTRMFGVTVSDGAYQKHINSDGTIHGPEKTESRFMAGEVIDLVGAGDSFRAGFIAYVAKNIDDFREGKMSFSDAIQMGNLFAALYIKAPLDDRYVNIKSYEKLESVIVSGLNYDTFDKLMARIQS